MHGRRQHFLVELLDGNIESMSRKDVEKILRMVGFKDKTKQLLHNGEDNRKSQTPYSHPLIEGDEIVLSLPKTAHIEGNLLRKIGKMIDQLLEKNPNICNPQTTLIQDVSWADVTRDGELPKKDSSTVLK